MNTEAWRPFREGTYEVSSIGNVRRAKPGTSTFIGRPLIPIAAVGGYQRVDLRTATGGGVRRLYIHRIVAEAFIGERPHGHVVNHRDGNRQNNTVENLEYVTPRENSQHALSTLPRRRGPKMPRPPKAGLPTGERHWTRRMPDRIARGERLGSKLTAATVASIRERLAVGERQVDLAREFKISVAQMSRVARGKRWAHVGGVK